MQFGAIGCALRILGVLESLDAHEWGWGQKMTVCVLGIPCSGIILEDFLERFFSKLKAHTDVASSF